MCKAEMFQKRSKLREICICHMSSAMVMLSAAMQVSCLSYFTNLERLDLSFNNLTSLQWLAVVQNKLESLNGIEALSKLTLSLSNCQLHTVGSSLKYCTELKELRLSHSSIRTLPAELARNKKLQNLDLGNNAIIRWSDLEVLASLVNLKNLNLQGNPVAEKDKLAKKIKEVLPNLKIFNTKPADKYTNNSDVVDKVDDSYVNSTNKAEVQKDKKRDDFMKNSKHHVNGSKQRLIMLKDLGEDSPLDNAIGVDVEKKLKKKRPKTNGVSSEKETPVCEDERRDDIKKNNSEHHVVELSKDNAEDVHVEKESRHKKQKNDKLSKKQVPVHAKALMEDGMLIIYGLLLKSLTYRLKFRNLLCVLSLKLAVFLWIIVSFIVARRINSCPWYMIRVE
ncbi:hypothetical protein SO802_014106 [Lithocarpus litseifolius]|uniref:Uncharacterized protein n=1 Tax=Lithocarpus litseifolius TaxID=425828 RepID=A0AAW2CU46_9ROSI